MPASTPSLTLHQLLCAASCPPPASFDPHSITITGLDYDSRRIQHGYLFFAFPGDHVDGAQFAPEAVARGAVAVVAHSQPPPAFPVPWIVTPHPRRVMALMARAFYPHVAEQLLLTGATGTNGKTTTCTLHDSILRAAGFQTALIGTISHQIAGQSRRAINTTPESLDLYRMFDELLLAGGRHATIEVSSHALALGRCLGFRFQTAIFTNLSRDHLDFHHTMEAYFDAKSELFRGQHAPPPRFAVLNADDSWAHRIPIAPTTQTIWYGLGQTATLRAADVHASFSGLRFTVHWHGAQFPVHSPLTGLINVYNILAAFAAALCNQLPHDAILEGIRRCSAVAGRFEKVDQGQPFLVVVDYAHTDDALRNTIQTARSLASGRVITVFGCGGNRDRDKRPLMGQVAGSLSDYVVLTSDNPRDEDPLAIIHDALAGLSRTGAPFHLQPDRAAAIAHAIAAAHPGDVVLIAGKGHEDYQVLAGGRSIHFDDREVARACLRQAGYPRSL